MNIDPHQNFMVLMKNTDILRWKDSTNEKFKRSWLLNYENCGNELYKTA